MKAFFGFSLLFLLTSCDKQFINQYVGNYSCIVHSSSAYLGEQFPDTTYSETILVTRNKSYFVIDGFNIPADELRDEKKYVIGVNSLGGLYSFQLKGDSLFTSSEKSDWGAVTSSYRNCIKVK
jgi:hypothetical protein